MIEIAPKEYWIDCTCHEGKMYLEFLVIDGKKGWRVANYDEAFINAISGWKHEQMYHPVMDVVKLPLVPVRDHD